jgi:hypothetical protein
MLKSSKLKKANARSFRFRLGIAAFVLGVGLGYSITSDKISANQLVSLSERVKTVLFVKTTDTKNEG